MMKMMKIQINKTMARNKTPHIQNSLKEYFESYVRHVYHGSSRPLRYPHLIKGCLEEFIVKMALNILQYSHTSAQDVGIGEDFKVKAGPLPIAIECKNEKYHTETAQSIKKKVLTRFKTYPKHYPKLLITTPMQFTDEARAILVNHSIQVIQLSKDINSLDEFVTMLKEVIDKLCSALYKFVHYDRYQGPEQEMIKPSIEKEGIEGVSMIPSHVVGDAANTLRPLHNLMLSNQNNHQPCNQSQHDLEGSIMTNGIKIFTDGACLGNSGSGGWAVLMKEDGNTRQLGGHESNTTNNRMELRAAIEGLKCIPSNSTVEIITDSQYLSKGITEWMPKWKEQGWKTSKNKLVKNQDLWRELDQLARNRVKWKWVRGHANHVENEIVNRLAQTYARKETMHG
jgi:ribonuclease HI